MPIAMIGYENPNETAIRKAFESGDPKTASQVKEETGLHLNTIRKYIEIFVKTGLLVKGNYVPRQGFRYFAPVANTQKGFSVVWSGKRATPDEILNQMLIWAEEKRELSDIGVGYDADLALIRIFGLELSPEDREASLNYLKRRRNLALRELEFLNNLLQPENNTASFRLRLERAIRKMKFGVDGTDLANHLARLRVNCILHLKKNLPTIVQGKEIR